jgi:hypothetical protein
MALWRSALFSAGRRRGSTSPPRFRRSIRRAGSSGAVPHRGSQPFMPGPLSLKRMASLSRPRSRGRENMWTHRWKPCRVLSTSPCGIGWRPQTHSRRQLAASLLSMQSAASGPNRLFRQTLPPGGRLPRLRDSGSLDRGRAKWPRLARGSLWARGCQAGLLDCPGALVGDSLGFEHSA